MTVLSKLALLAGGTAEAQSACEDDVSMRGFLAQVVARSEAATGFACDRFADPSGRPERMRYSIARIPASF